jgi:crossover junction endodeoxyribonuclease RusA
MAHSWGYKSSLKAIHLLALSQTTGTRPKYPTGELAAFLRFYPPSKRKLDVANYIKGTMDALEGVLYADDYQVSRFVVRRMEPDRENPRLELDIEEAS